MPDIKAGLRPEPKQGGRPNVITGACLFVCLSKPNCLRSYDQILFFLNAQLSEAQKARTGLFVDKSDNPFSYSAPFSAPSCDAFQCDCNTSGYLTGGKL